MSTVLHNALKSTLPTNFFKQVLIKPVLKCKQQLKNYFWKIKILKGKKKNFFGILKIRCGILLYSNNFFPVFKN